MIENVITSRTCIQFLFDIYKLVLGRTRGLPVDAAQAKDHCRAKIHAHHASSIYGGRHHHVGHENHRWLVRLSREQVWKSERNSNSEGPLGLSCCGADIRISLLIDHVSICIRSAIKKSGFGLVESLPRARNCILKDEISITSTLFPMPRLPALFHVGRGIFSLWPFRCYAGPEPLNERSKDMSPRSSVSCTGMMTRTCDRGRNLKGKQLFVTFFSWLIF